MFNDASSFLNPIHFFSVSADCYFLKNPKELASTPYLLGNSCDLSGERECAKVYIGWSEKGLFFHFDVKASLDDESKIELFIDTRDVKTSGYNTRFCHHFFFSPSSKQEKTHFRNPEEMHPLCPQNLLESHFKKEKSSFKAEIFIPKECLTGYEPHQLGRLGFTYRVSSDGSTQHFSVLSSDYNFEELPALWASLNLTTYNGKS